MALIFADGFDHYGNKRPAQKWGVGPVASNITGVIASTAAPVKNGTHSLKLPGGQTLPSMVFPYNKSVLAGFWVYFPSLPNTGLDLLQIRKDELRHLGLRVDPTSRRFQVRGENDQILLNGTTVVGVGTWYHIELRAVLNRGSGELKFRVNMIPEVHHAGIDTAHTDGLFPDSNDGAWNRVALTGVVADAYTVVDDFYLSNLDGPAPYNNFLGEVRVETIYPQTAAVDGSGLRGDMKPYPTGETDRGKQVDEHAPNTVDYNIAPQHLLELPDGNREIVDTYNYPNMGQLRKRMIDNVEVEERIMGIQANPYVQRDQQVNEMYIEAFIQSDGENNVGTATPVEEFWDYYPHMFETNPSNGAEWTEASVNTIKMGIRVFRSDFPPVYPPA